MRVFDDDEHIVNFMTNDEVFKESIIDDEEYQAGLQNRYMFIGNFMPKVVRTLEGMFDLQHKFKKPSNVQTNNLSIQYELVNLGMEVEPKYVNLGKCCSPGERFRFINCFKNIKIYFLEHMNI